MEDVDIRQEYVSADLMMNLGYIAEKLNATKEGAVTYTVQSGDTMWDICRRFYGDGSLCWRLAAANGIANANLIRPGQVLTIPPLAQLPAAAARPPSAKIAAATKVREVKEEESGTARLVPWVPENTVKSLVDLELDKIASGGGLWQSTRW